MADYNMKSMLVFMITYLCLNPVMGDPDRVSLKFSYVLSSSAVDPVYGVRLDSTVPAVDLALHYINNNSSLLPGYNLKYTTILRTECGQRAGLDTFFNAILSEHTLGVMGCACSQTTLAIADVINYWNIPQIACNPFSQGRISREDSSHEHLFQLHPQPRHYAQAVSTFIKQFGWERMSIISQDDSIYQEVKLHIMDILKEGNVSIIDPRLLQNISADIQGDELFPDDVRIFFLNMESSYAKFVLCKAHAMEMHFPHYVWLTYSDETGAFQRAETQCELTEALDGLFTLRSTPSTAASENNARGMLESVYASLSHPYTPLAKFAYDSVMTFATLLNKTLTVLENGNVDEMECQNRNGTAVRLERFTFENDLMGCVFLSVLRNLTLEGLTDHISFDSRGERRDISMGLYQYRPVQGELIPPEATIVGEIDTEAMTFAYAQEETARTLFRGSIPLDGTPLERINAMPLPLIVVYYSIAMLGIVFSIFCLLFNIIFRKRKIVKLTSPNLNYFILLGALLIYGSVYVRVYFDSSELYNDIRCNLQVILNCVGYALVFSPILVKMWRVYYIFHNPLPNKKAMKDWHLALAVTVMVAVILVMSIVGAAFSALRPDLVLKPDNERPTGQTENGIRINLFSWECYDSIIPFVWVALEYVVLLLFQVAAIILAFKTRKVKIKELNDSKSVAAIIYITSVVMAALIIITFATDGFIVLAEALFSGGLMLATSVSLSLIFIPKMVALCRDPEGESVMKSSVNTDTTRSSVFKPSGLGNTSTLDGNCYKTPAFRLDSEPAKASDGTCETVSQLKKRIVELESELLSYQQNKA